jgi:hypothetical protein
MMVTPCWNVINLTISRSITATGHSARMGDRRDTYKVFMGKRGIWRPLGKQRYEYELQRAGEVRRTSMLHD